MNEAGRARATAADAVSPLPPSLWAATALPGPALDRLAGRKAAEVVIVGAGYTGLSTALHLAEAGREAAVIDAHEPGWGASGRNGGQVLPGLRPLRADVQRIFGAEAGGRLYDFCDTAPSFLFKLVERHGIGCDLVQTGHFRLARNERTLALVRESTETMRADGIPVRFLDADAVARETGSPAYLGGRYDPRSGNLHPLKYARGLAAAALRKGAAIFRESPVLGVEQDGRKWRVRTAEGEVLAHHVVLATNGYTDRLWPRLAETLLPVHSFQVATAPLGAAELATVLPGRPCFSDSRRLILYAQRSGDGRLVLGGRASFTLADRAGDYDVLRRVLTELFPQLEATPIEFRWAGRVALTRDFMPHLHAPASGVLAAVGFNGKGVAMTTLMGKILADRILAPDTPSPFPTTGIRAFPFHAFRQPALHLAMYYHTLMDRLGR